MFFKSEKHISLWSVVCGRTFIRENYLHLEKANHLGINDHLHEMNMSKSVLNLPTFVKQLILEFYCNLSLDNTVKNSTHFHKSFIWGMHINFSRDIINTYLGFVLYHGVCLDRGMNIVVVELTGGQIRSWPLFRGMRASSLTFKYSVLHKIALRNWSPNSHSSLVRNDLATLLYKIGTQGYLDLGQVIFINVIKHATK